MTPPPPEQTDAAPAAYGAPGPPEPAPSAQPGDVLGEALPVLAERPNTPVVQRARRGLARELDRATIPAVGAAAVAAGSFVAGAAVAGLVHRRARGRAALARGSRAGGRALSPRKSSRGVEALQIVGTRTLLVDVHVLGTPGSEH
ncbi:MAG TPA: hypothetical protein VHT27_00755 [Solirubrobacteraceae bacterium]|nr:hypothetical protein [Solirubrobacteraceae bacterium]